MAGAVSVTSKVNSFVLSDVPLTVLRSTRSPVSFSLVKSAAGMFAVLFASTVTVTLFPAGSFSTMPAWVISSVMVSVIS